MSDLTIAQNAALDELRSITASLTQIAVVQHIENGGRLKVVLELDTSGFRPHPEGLPVQTTEHVLVDIGPAHPFVPPTVKVGHTRWAGFPHVLQGTRLCIYLDVHAEWVPQTGMRGFLRRLWDWFDDAVANNFDRTAALYHPVGGVLHRHPGAPTVVASDSIPSIRSQDVARRIALRQRTKYRIDIASWAAQPGENLVGGLLVTLPEQIPLGGGNSLDDLLKILREQGGRDAKRQLINRLRRATRALDVEQHLHLIIAVPNSPGHQGASHHLIGWRLTKPQATQALSGATRATNGPAGDKQTEVQWTFVDDRRPEANQRRDSDRPVSVYAGSTVAVWGCGAIGSWIAELLVRAGIRKLILRDPAYVTTGLLVRQNYTEEDVGRKKAEALADSLRNLSDQLDILPLVTLGEVGTKEDGDECDFIFDCTVSTSVNSVISSAQRDGTLDIPVVQVATDNQTATLGILTVTDGHPAPTTQQLDQLVHRKAQQDPKLKPYLAFWQTDDRPPLVPTPGCSVPTFHGSAADAMSIAATAVNLSAIVIDRKCSGGYLFSTPYSAYGALPLTEVYGEIPSREKHS